MQKLEDKAWAVITGLDDATTTGLTYDEARTLAEQHAAEGESSAITTDSAAKRVEREITVL